MGDKSAISWTNATWNPVTGCSVVSPGCEHCYAATLSLRYGWTKKPWTAINAAENVVLHEDRLSLPLRWQKPRMIFVNSMSDLFHEQVPDEFIRSVFQTMQEAERHTFQVLTKRPLRMAAWVERYIADGYGLTDNVWLGTSVEDQRRADERIPWLLRVPSKVRFLSCEPLLGPIDLYGPRYRVLHVGLCSAFNGGQGINWVIDGGESGSGYRPADLGWFRALRDQCQAAGVPYFHKQGSAFRSGQDTLLDGREWHEFPA